MPLVLSYVLAALALGGYTTYLIATALPRSLLDRASRHGRFAGMHDGASLAVAHTKADAEPDAPTPATRPVAGENANRC